MKYRHIIGIVLLSLLLPPSAWAGSVRQMRDTIIIDNVKYAGHTALAQLDSLHYCTLRDQLPFDNYFSWNFRGYVATWRVANNRLYLERITSDANTSDFREILRDFKDDTGHIFASWFSGTLVCGTGPVLWKDPRGWDDLNETEIALTIESGVIVSSRKYTNRKRDASAERKRAFKEIRDGFNYEAFPELNGKKVGTYISALRIDESGRIVDWNIEFLRWPEDVDAFTQTRLASAIKKEMSKCDWTTYNADGRWFWMNRLEKYDKVFMPLFFGGHNTKQRPEVP